MNKNQKGFGAIGVLLIIVIAGIVGGCGYYVYQSQQNNQADKQAEPNTKEQLVLFTDSTKLYSFSYPKGWIIKDLGASELTYGGIPIKFQSVAINYPDGPQDFDPIIISSDKTPNQTQQIMKAWEAAAKDEPFSTISINGYTTLHRHTEEAATREDAYLIIDKDQSSVLFSVTSKMTSPHKNDTNFDATDKLENFKAIVNSIKFL